MEITKLVSFVVATQKNENYLVNVFNYSWHYFSAEIQYTLENVFGAVFVS